MWNSEKRCFEMIREKAHCKDLQRTVTRWNMSATEWQFAKFVIVSLLVSLRTYMRGPLIPHGHGKPLSKEVHALVSSHQNLLFSNTVWGVGCFAWRVGSHQKGGKTGREIGRVFWHHLLHISLSTWCLVKEFGMVEPERAFMDEKDVEWRHGGARVYLVSIYISTIYSPVFSCLDFLPSKVWRTSRLYNCQLRLSQGVWQTAWWGPYSGGDCLMLCNRLFPFCRVRPRTTLPDHWRWLWRTWPCPERKSLDALRSEHLMWAFCWGEDVGNGTLSQVGSQQAPEPGSKNARIPENSQHQKPKLCRSGNSIYFKMEIH